MAISGLTVWSKGAVVDIRGVPNNSDKNPINTTTYQKVRAVPPSQSRCRFRTIAAPSVGPNSSYLRTSRRLAQREDESITIPTPNLSETQYYNRKDGDKTGQIITASQRIDVKIWVITEIEAMWWWEPKFKAVQVQVSMSHKPESLSDGEASYIVPFTTKLGYPSRRRDCKARLQGPTKYNRVLLVRKEAGVCQDCGQSETIVSRQPATLSGNGVVRRFGGSKLPPKTHKAREKQFIHRDMGYGPNSKSMWLPLVTGSSDRPTGPSP
ncbi:hypothetical protein K438DRAFT_1932959 [Mycena galopus ATCC 62051]|nr:hypothetical protein K438DRAFT_1932959 [Mycena galopus ATCC 62051]